MRSGREPLDREALVERLGRITHKKDEKRAEEYRERMSLGDSLLTLADITHEQEWSVCQSVAKRLLGAVPEPDDTERR